MKYRLILPVLSFSLLAGCTTLAPEYSRPALTVDASLPQYADPQVITPLATALSWREFILHPQLREIIELALENNRDMRVAVLNLQRARALYRVEGSARLPNVDITASGSHTGLSASQSDTGEETTAHEYSIGLGTVGYELDLFGRVRNLEQSALESYFATEQARRAMELTLIADVANAYLALTADTQRLDIAENTLDNQLEAYKIQKTRFDRGALSELELIQVQTQVETARVEVAHLKSLVVRDTHVLRLLAGTDIPREFLLPEVRPTMHWFQSVSAGISSDILLQRPDVMQAEHKLRAANADIGVARAAFFPRISLTAGLGSASSELSDLFGGGSSTWQFIPSLSLPIFNAGRNEANLEIAKADQQIAKATYEQSIQRAFREVADSLAEDRFNSDQLDAQHSLAAATAQAYKLAKLRYEQGIDGYLQVLDAQRSDYEAQQNLVRIQQEKMSAELSIYKALGGLSS
ncbi:MAG: efflux transporter outer membrane subunit [Candidatus Thiodiazotropha sp. (ex Monitilora ramsayi)]|nr:efflux transporter outer membrane subunit [Candidatus Thiodiazotropha sp. (ex Monitilora ramsayi)]